MITGASALGSKEPTNWFGVELVCKRQDGYRYEGKEREGEGKEAGASRFGPGVDPNQRQTAVPFSRLAETPSCDLGTPPEKSPAPAQKLGPNPVQTRCKPDQNRVFWGPCTEVRGVPTGLGRGVGTWVFNGFGVCQSPKSPNGPCQNCSACKQPKPEMLQFGSSFKV